MADAAPEPEGPRPRTPVAAGPAGAAEGAPATPTTGGMPRSLSSLAIAAQAVEADMSRYVARHVRLLYQERKGAPLTAPLMIKRDFAVVALADVSGYSLLTNHLRTRGNQGAEMLTNLLNPYFHFVIDIIEKSGGDVIKFIGDAILVKWDPQGRSQEETLAMACWGCLRLLERLGDHVLTIPDEATTFPLSMHIGLGAGVVYDMHVGSEKYNRWEYFVDGEAVQEALTLVNIARKKELAVSDTAGNLLQNEVSLLKAGVTAKLAKMEDGYILQNLNWLGADEAMLATSRERDRNTAIPPQPVYRMYINESAVERIQSGHESLINELRSVAVIFARFDPGPDGAPRRNKCQSVMVGTMAILRTYEGTLRQIVTDDKGTSLLIVFGLPPWSHENDAVFALRAALEMRKLFESLFSDWAIAVTSGMLFTGIIGGRTRADHTIMGDVVNSAARLMISDLCRNKVMCDRETRNASLKDVICDPNPIEFTSKKGKAIVYKVDQLITTPAGTPKVQLGSKQKDALRPVASGGRASPVIPARSLRPPALVVGREEELEIMRAALERHLLGEGDPPRIVVEGPGGMGKTALIKVFMEEEAAKHGLPFTMAKGDEVDQSTPLFAFRDIVADLLDLILEAPSPAQPASAQTSPTDGAPTAAGSEAAPNGTATAAPAPAASAPGSTSPVPPVPNSPPPPTPNGPSGVTAAAVRQARSSAGSLRHGGGYLTPDGYAATASGRSRSLYQSMRLSPPALERFMQHPELNFAGDPSSEGDRRPSAAPSGAAGITGGAAAAGANGAAASVAPVVGPDALPLPKGTEGGDALVRRIAAALTRLKMDVETAPLVRQVYAMPENSRPAAKSASGSKDAPSTPSASGSVRAAADGTPSPQHEPETEAAALGLDIGGRFDTLAEVLVAMINRMTSATVPPSETPASTEYNLANLEPMDALLPNGLGLALDDAQWLDSMSWALLAIIARRCPRLFLVISLRKFGRSTADPLQRIESLPGTKSLQLAGLPPAAVGKLVAHVYGENVTSVHEKLLDNIMSKTGGNPLFVEHMAVAMKGQRYLVVSGTGELFFKPKQNPSELDALFPRDLQTAMLVQFDRLPQDLQLILRVASVIGQNFNLEIVAKLIMRDKASNNLGLTADVCLKRLSDLDASAFVYPAMAAHAVDKSLRYNFAFKSAMLQKCVYSTMLYTQREKFHQQAALLYEYQMTSDNRAQLLPLIHYHYERTHNIIKRIEYLEQVAEMHMANTSYAEAAASFKKLLNTLGILDVSKRTLYSTNRRAQWHKNLGIAYVNTNDWAVGQSHLMEALRLLEFPGPLTRKELQTALVKQMRKQQKYWSRRSEDARTGSRPSEVKDVREIPRIRTICEILGALHDALLYTTQTDMALWAVLTRINLCESLGEFTCRRFGLHFGHAESATALTLFLSGKQSLALEYFNRAEAVSRRSEMPDDLRYYFVTRSVAHFAAGEARQAYRLLDTLTSQADVATCTGPDVNTRRRDADLFFSAIALLSGRMTVGFERAKRCFDEASDHGEEAFAITAAAAMASTLVLAPEANGNLGQAGMPVSWIRVLAMSDPSTESMGVNSAIFVTAAVGLYNAYTGRVPLVPGQLETIHRTITHTPLVGALHLPLVGLFFMGLALLEWYDSGYAIDVTLVSLLAGGEAQRASTSTPEPVGRGSTASNAARTDDIVGRLPVGAGTVSMSVAPLFPSLASRRSSLPSSVRSDKSVRTRGGAGQSIAKGRRQSIQTDADIMGMSVLGLPPISSSPGGDSPRTSFGDLPSSSSGSVRPMSGTASPAVAAYLGTLSSKYPEAAGTLGPPAAAAGSLAGSRQNSGGIPASSLPAAPSPLSAGGSGSGGSTPTLPSPEVIFVEYVQGVLRVLKPLRRTWALATTLYLFFQALELLPKHSRSEKVSALMQKAALSVPEGMPLMKTALLTRALWFSPAPTNRKLAVERRKLVDNTLGLAHNIGLKRESDLLDQIISVMDATLDKK